MKDGKNGPATPPTELIKKKIGGWTGHRVHFRRELFFSESKEELTKKRKNM